MRNIKAFTLIELLVVISIIGILAGLSIFGVDAYFQSSRDTQRKSDLKQYQTALEAYANKNSGLYYSSGTTNPSGNSAFCTAMGLTSCAADPTTTQNYNFQSNGSGGATATQYVLWATLENPSSPTTYWVVCSNGKSATATSGIPPAGGACPLP